MLFTPDSVAMTVPKTSLLRRARDSVLHRLQRLPDRFYRQRHPGPKARRVISLLAPVVLRMQPNDKWNLHVFAREWMKSLEQPPCPPLPTPRRLFLFTAYRIQFTQDLVLASLLAWRGHQVTIGYLPKLQSPIKEPLIDHPSAKPYLKAALSCIERMTDGRIRCIDLSDEVNEDAPVNEEFVESQCHADVVIRLAREALDPTDPAVSRALTYYSALGRMAQRIAWTHLSRHGSNYDLCLVPNGATYEGAHFCWAARRLGIPVNTLEKFAFRFVRVINHGDHFLAFGDLDEVWNRRRELGFEAEPFFSQACARARKLMDERRTSSAETWAWKYQRAQASDITATLSGLGIGSDVPYILVGTNIPFDAGYAGLLTVFPSMREWLVATVSYLLENTELHVVVRAHPGESRYHAERSEWTLAEAGVKSDRLVVIPGAIRVNTYPLMEHCKFGVVFSSTVGLEMAMLGKQVLLGTHVYYGRRGFTIDPMDRSDYFAKLKSLTTSDTSLGVSPETAQQACLFHFIMHFVMQWPYPYDKPSSVAKRAPAELVTSPEITDYLPSLDALTVKPAEWSGRMNAFLGASAIMGRLPEEMRAAQ